MRALLRFAEGPLRGPGRVPDPRLVRAKERLDRLDWWPRPVRIGRVRIVVTPLLFRLRPWRRFDGFATHLVIFLRHAGVGDDLITHELCHVWQMQHRPITMPLSYLRTGYDRSPYERQARSAARLGSGTAGA
ncbi:MAG: hypothetical protein M5U27_14345 [Gaiella sp.]|nr:hypothetical protein [Gaiella sp.]